MIYEVGRRANLMYMMNKRPGLTDCVAGVRYDSAGIGKQYYSSVLVNARFRAGQLWLACVSMVWYLPNSILTDLV